MTIKIFIATILLGFACGCTKIEYNPTTNDFKYTAPPFGKKIGSVSVIREADGSVLFEMSDFESERMAELAGEIAYGITKGVTK